MKYARTAKNPIDSYAKYKPEMGKYYEQLIDACVKWESLCAKHMFDPSKLQELLNSEELKEISGINDKITKELHGDGIKSFLIEMVNGQHTDLLIPYLTIEKDLPDDFANIHVGLLGSGEQIFEIIN